jgi:hypothetical protein
MYAIFDTIGDNLLIYVLVMIINPTSDPYSPLFLHVLSG